MTVTLATVRTAVKSDLRETGAGDWSDAQVDAAIALAVAEYGRSAPLQKTVDYGGMSNTRTLTISDAIGATDYGLLVNVDGVEYPVDQWPPIETKATRWGDQLTIHSAELISDTVRLYYTTAHTLDSVTSTIPEKDAEILELGAAGYALQQLATGDVNTLALNSRATIDARSLAADKLRVFREGLRRLRRRVRSGRMYRAEPAEPGRDVVSFPE